MEDLNIKKLLSKILLYAIIGISFFAFFILTFAFIIGDLDVMSWSEGNRFAVLYCWFSAVVLSTVAIEVR